MQARQTQPGVAICLRERLLPQSQTEISLRLCFYQGRLALIGDIPPRGFSSRQAHFFRCHLGRVREAPALCPRMGWKPWHCGLLRDTARRKPPKPLAAPFTKKHVVQEDLEPRLWRQPLCLRPRSKGTVKGWLCSCSDAPDAQCGTQKLSRPRNLLSYLLGKFRNRRCPMLKRICPSFWVSLGQDRPARKSRLAPKGLRGRPSS